MSRNCGLNKTIQIHVTKFVLVHGQHNSSFAVGNIPPLETFGCHQRHDIERHLWSQQNEYKFLQHHHKMQRKIYKLFKYSSCINEYNVRYVTSHARWQNISRDRVVPTAKTNTCPMSEEVPWNKETSSFETSFETSSFDCLNRCCFWLSQLLLFSLLTTLPLFDISGTDLYCSCRVAKWIIFKLNG